MNDAAKEYGTALYELCAEEKIADQVLLQLEEIQTLVKQNPQWMTLLASPIIPQKERLKAADDAMHDRVHRYVLDFVKLLIEHGRVRDFSGAVDCYHQLYNEANGILEVTAVSALPMSEDQQQRLSDKLAAMTGKTIHMTNKVDAACMGGVRLEMEGRSIDGSVKAQLELLRQNLMRASSADGI